MSQNDHRFYTHSFRIWIFARANDDAAIYTYIKIIALCCHSEIDAFCNSDMTIQEAFDPNMLSEKFHLFPNCFKLFFTDLNFTCLMRMSTISVFFGFIFVTGSRFKVLCS